MSLGVKPLTRQFTLSSPPALNTDSLLDIVFSSVAKSLEIRLDQQFFMNTENQSAEFVILTRNLSVPLHPADTAFYQIYVSS